MTDITNTPAEPTPETPEAEDPIQAVETPERVAKPEPVDYDAQDRIPLKDYKQGQSVVVWDKSDWRAGFVNSLEKRDGTNVLLYIHTDRGPVTIMSDRNIRPA